MCPAWETGPWKSELQDSWRAKQMQMTTQISLRWYSMIIRLQIVGFGNVYTHLCIPEHWMHRVMPRLMLAQRGSGCPQSQQVLLPAMPMTLSSALSPLRDFSRISPLDSRLPVDAPDFLSIFCQTHPTAGYYHIFLGMNYMSIFSKLPRHPPPCPWKLSRCYFGRLWSRPAWASPSLPASYNSCAAQKNIAHSDAITIWSKDRCCAQTHFVGETTSKQNRRSTSSQCLTVHNRKSSTTTVGLSWKIKKEFVPQNKTEEVEIF